MTNLKKALFTEGRYSRKAYWIHKLIEICMFFIVAFMIKFLPDSFQIPTFLMAILTVTYLEMVSTIKRYHDLGKSGARALLLFIPILNIVEGVGLCVIRGMKGDNKFGPDPFEAQLKDKGVITPSTSEDLLKNGVTIGDSVTIGNNAYIKTGSVIGNDTNIGNDIHDVKF